MPYNNVRCLILLLKFSIPLICSSEFKKCSLLSWKHAGHQRCRRFFTVGILSRLVARVHACQRQSEQERTAFAQFAFGPDPSAVSFNNALSDGQTETCSLLPCVRNTPEPIEDFY